MSRALFLDTVELKDDMKDMVQKALEIGEKAHRKTRAQTTKQSAVADGLSH